MKASGINTQSDGIPLVTFEHDHNRKRSQENSISVKTIEIVRKSNEEKSPRDLKLADFDVKAKNFDENQTCPLYRKHDSRNFMIARFDPKCPKTVTAQILSKGVDVCYKTKPGVVERYTFFAHSASQLRNRVCVLYNNNRNVGKAEDIISEFGDFSKLKTAAKRAARIGLLLSTAGETVKLRNEDVSRIDDVERNDYTFTDGCGYISPVVAEMIADHLGISAKYKHQIYPYPSVFQVRLLGCKGVLSLKPSLEKGVEIRKSMEKFKWSLPEPFPLGVVDKGYSRPYEVGSLNKQFILLLSALGIHDDVFLRKQKTYFQEILSLTSNKETAFIYLCAFGEIEIAERLLNSDTIDELVLAKVKSIQQRVYGSPNKSVSELEKTKKSPALRLKIPIEKSRNVYGVSDPSENDLKYGTCFFQPTIRGEAKPIVGKVVVAKNPCYSPGDVRVLDCVDAPCCHHLVDCIVFPTDGERPHPDEIAGSDLDGDKFFVCWDPDLVPYKCQDPVSYPAAKVPQKKVILQKDLIDYFSRYSSSAIGKIDHHFAQWADRKGVASIECQELSALFSRAVDSAKTGEKVVIPKHLQITSDHNPSQGNFVWHKMAAEATIFIENKVKNPERYRDVQISEETLRTILTNDLISVSDYQLFRFLCKWAAHEEGISEEQLSNIAKDCIDFTTFSLPQLRRAQIDCPGLATDVLLNPFIRSKILAEVDCTDLIPQTSDHYTRYSLVFRACAEDLSWDILNNVLTSGLAKILVFKFLIGNIEWVCVLDMPQQLESRETLEVNEAEHSLPRAFLFIHQDKPISERYCCNVVCQINVVRELSNILPIRSILVSN
jgi:regulator of nonsense transcripts 1